MPTFDWSLLKEGAILAAIIRIIWSLISWLLIKLRLFFATKKELFSIPLSQYNEQIDFLIRNTKFYCLLVRHGTDQYIKNMATEQEKHDGRLQNKVIKSDVGKSKDNKAHLKFQIPVHRRIGTQFKCFVEVDDKKEVQNVRATLNEFDQVKVVDDLEEMKQYSNRLFFLLKGFGEFETIDHLKNNMWFPV